MLSVAMTLSLPRKENKEKLILTYNYFGENYTIILMHFGMKVFSD